jgi:photosystem II stability/assembly factor-like uncharacterized protein
LNKYKKILISLILINGITHSQWTQLSSGTTNILLGINFPDANTGFVAGSPSTIIKTTNEGLNWNSQSNPPGHNLWGIYFVNTNTGYATGESSTLIKTTNGGSSWDLITLPIFNNFGGIYFTDANTGYIAGWNGKIIKTTNGGNNWIELTTNTTSNLNKIYFPNNTTGFACGGAGVVIKTIDAGAGWTTLTTGITDNIFGIYAVNTDTIYICCEDGKLYKSTNGGSGWVQQTSGTTQRLYDIYFINALTGTAVGLSNTIIRTTNGGALWLTQQSGVTGQDFYSVWFTNVTTGYVCGSNGVLLKTITGGFPYPSQPVLTAPVNGATGVSLTTVLDWDTVTTAATYSLLLDTDTLFATPVIDTNLLVNAQMQVPPGRLLNNTVYYWKVRGVNIVGNGPYSAIFHFRTIHPAPVPPTLLIPVNGASNVPLTPTFDWDSTVIVNYYNLQAALDTSFSDLKVDASGITQSFLPLVLPLPPLQNNFRYYWRVNAVNEAGTSAWSQVHNFTTVIGFPSPPTLLSPPDGSIGISLRPTLRWVEDISAINYQAQISTDSMFASTVIDTVVTDSSQVTIRPGVLQNIQTYYWRVRTTNSVGTSNWSLVWDFFTLLSPPIAPVLFSPQNDTTDVNLTPTLYWLPVQYAQSYRVQLADNPLFNNLLINLGSLPGTQYPVSSGTLQNNTYYYWRVNATNGAGTGPFSAVWRFKTVVSPPVVAPTLISPPNGATNQSVTPTLDWNDVFNSLGYRLLVSTDSLFINPSVVDTTITPSQFTVPPGRLNPTTTYYWKVRGYNIGGFGPYSVSWHFTTGLIGIVQLSTGIPLEFNLHNNYPNPFNPVTKIKFDIPPSKNGKNILTKIVIYDILGKTVNIIIDEKLSPGYYEASWDAENCPSGIYFCRINAGEYTAVKKMVLLK